MAAGLPVNIGIALFIVLSDPVTPTVITGSQPGSSVITVTSDRCNGASPPVLKPSAPVQRAAVVEERISGGLPEPFVSLEAPSSGRIADRLNDERDAALARLRSA